MSVKYNIMTSCDAKMFKYVAIMLYELQENLPDALIDFYIFCTEEAASDLKLIEKTDAKLERVNCNVICFSDEEAAKYQPFADNGGSWLKEAYFSLCAHLYLDEGIDRILYLDCGDILVLGDIAPFYFGDFHGCSILAAAPLRYKNIDGKNVLYSSENVKTVEDITNVGRGLFNSGSYVINLNKLRKEKRTIDDYVAVMQDLRNLYVPGDKYYWGDQGLLGVFYLGDIAYADMNNLKILNMPYNFLLWYYEFTQEEPAYKPVIIHFVSTCKPWYVNYDDGNLEVFQNGLKLVSMESILPCRRKYYKIWYEYAIKVAGFLD